MKLNLKKKRYQLTKTYFSYPYLAWLGFFIIVPLFLILYYGLTVEAGEGVRFSLENLRRFFDPIHLSVMWKSVVLAFYCTVICFLLGYPVAMILASKRFVKKSFLIFLFILPMWMNMLLRTYAWMTILSRNGILNAVLGFLHLPSIDLLYTETAVLLGMVYDFLPFMVLPIYAVLSKMNKNIYEAAEDLGANSRVIFRRITFPLSLPGVVSGVVMVFMPAVSNFFIANLLGGGKIVLIGNQIEEQFIDVGNWHFGSALSLGMMFLMLLSLVLLFVYDPGHEKGALV